MPGIRNEDKHVYALLVSWERISHSGNNPGWCPWGHLYQPHPAFLGFVFQDLQELPPPNISDALGDPASCQSDDIQVFDRDQAIVLDQPLGQLVVKVAPLVGRSLMQTADSYNRPFFKRTPSLRHSAPT